MIQGVSSKHWLHFVECRWDNFGIVGQVSIYAWPIEGTACIFFAFLPSCVTLLQIWQESVVYLWWDALLGAFEEETFSSLELVGYVSYCVKSGGPAIEGELM